MKDKKLKIKLAPELENSHVFLDDGTELKMVQSVKVESSVGSYYRPKAEIVAYATEAEIELYQKDTELKIIIIGERKDGKVELFKE